MILSLRHEWPEHAGFTLSRPNGLSEWTLLVFYNSVRLLSEGEIITTAPGACILYEPGAPQWFCSETPLTHDWMHTDRGDDTWLWQLELPTNRVFYPKDLPRIHRLFWEMENEFYGDKPLGAELTHHLYRELTILLFRECRFASDEPLPGEEIRHLREIRRQILLHPERPWDVTHMAKQVGLSVSRFHAVFKTAFGTSPMETCIQARIRSAQHRLIGTDLPVKEIALSLGYRDLCHFTRQFRRVTGESPTAYRRHNV